jgi:hypothetical protein
MTDPAKTEAAFDLLAAALDRVGAERREVFLSALALSLADQLEDLGALETAIGMAEKAARL